MNFFDSSISLHTWNIIWITFVSGMFGGVINYFYFEQVMRQNEVHSNFDWKLFLKSSIVGIGAAFIVPLFLQTISSALLSDSKTNKEKFFVYAGFCLVASIFSKRFLDNIADNILKRVENNEKRINQNEDKVDAVIAKTSEPDEEENTEHINRNNKTLSQGDFSNLGKTNFNDILRALKESKYTYRTAKGIAKSLNSDEMTIHLLLAELETKGNVTKSVSSKTGKTLWSLTEKGYLSIVS